jgi:hypothetical protein
MTEFKETKFVILHDPKIEQEKLDELNDHLVLQPLNEKSYLKTISEMLERPQGLLIDMGDEAQRSWYSSQKSSIQNLSTVKRIYIAKNGNKIDIQKTKEQTFVQNVLKNLPQGYKNAGDFAARLLSDHIGSIGVGKMTRFWRWLKKKVSCC